MEVNLYTKLLEYPNVVGAGLGYKYTNNEFTGKTALVVMVSQKKPVFALSKDEMIPREFSSFVTDVLEVGDIRALPTGKWRPAPPGVSIGHYKISAGTLGAIVKDKETGEKFILSNNHVMANSNDAEIGDAILQPGPADGGNMDNQIASLHKFIPITFDGIPSCPFASGTSNVLNWIAERLGSSHRLQAIQIMQEGNLVDCALASPLNYDLITEEILGIGPVNGTILASLGMPVTKSGRTTGVTKGTIQVIAATVMVGYGSKTAKFEDQIITDFMSKGGDSGSLLLDSDTHKAVGLLFAGSDQVTIYNPIQHVMDKLDIIF